MRIALVVYGSIDSSTGGYLYDRQLVEHLRSHGDSVEVIELPHGGYARHLLDNVRPSLTRRLADGGFDVVLEDELNHPSLLAANQRLRHHTRCPVVAVVHLLRSSECQASVLRPLYARVEGRYLGGVDGALFNSEATRVACERLAGHPLAGVVARPGSDHLPRPAPDAAKSAAPDGVLRVLTLANVVRGKGIHAVVDAVRRLPADTWHLTVVGSLTTDPAYVERIRRQVDDAGLTDHVELAGEVPNEDVPRHLAAHDVMVLPSTYEAAGIAYLEAMRFGLPVVASAAGGARELVTDGREGFVVEPGDAATLAAVLRRWVEDRDLVVTMGAAARQRAAAHPTWGESFAPMRPFLESLVEARRSEHGRREPAR